MSIFIGVDPGLSGAIAAVHDSGKVIGVWDSPVLTIEKKTGVRHELNRVEMASLVREILHSRDELGEPFACVERVNAMPDQGVTSSFSFGMGYGIWLGILTTLHVPIDLVHPTRWKKKMLDGMNKSKDADRMRAIDLWPDVDFSLKKHHGRADALLIAEYRRRIG